MAQCDRLWLSNGVSKIAHDLHGNDATEGRTADIEVDECLDFSGMLLSEPVLRGLRDAGFRRPSPIQLKAIPTARCGVDLIVQAKSGTGKTCVFVVVALEAVTLSSNSTQAVILAPTREIACQIFEAVQVIGRYVEGLKSACFIGGKVGKDDKILAKQAQIVVGSPGRISQLIQDGDLCVDGVRLFVLDEADKLMDESYQENINWVYSKLPTNKQILVLSATFSTNLDGFLKKYMRNPQMIKLDSLDAQLLGIKQYLSVLKVTLGENWLDQRIDELHELLSKITFSQCLIFCNFQDKVEYLCKKLKEKQWPAEFIGAHISQSQRLNVIKRLKTFRCRVLISTDLTARGIDAEHVNLVINFDIPHSNETYLHRIGRAGRFGGYGASLTLLSGWQAELNFYQMIDTQKLRVKKLPDQFPLDIVANVAFYDQLPAFEVPDLSLYEQKAVVKAAKKTTRAIGYETYAKITKTLQLKRSSVEKFCLEPFLMCSPDEKLDRSMKYDRQLMFKVLRCISGLPEEDPPVASVQRESQNLTAKSVKKTAGQNCTLEVSQPVPQTDEADLQTTEQPLKKEVDGPTMQVTKETSKKDDDDPTIETIEETTKKDDGPTMEDPTSCENSAQSPAAADSELLGDPSSKSVKNREPSMKDYFRSLSNSYDDYLSLVYAGFNWHSEVAQRFENTAVGGSAAVLAGFHGTEAVQGESHGTEAAQFVNYSSDGDVVVTSVEDDIQCDEGDESEECGCWLEYTKVLRTYEKALEKAIEQQVDDHTPDDALLPWAEYFGQVRRFRDSCKFQN